MALPDYVINTSKYTVPKHLFESIVRGLDQKRFTEMTFSTKILSNSIPVP